MKIQLRKITSTPSEFDIESDKITFKGFLQYHADKLILLKAKLEGVTQTECSRCGEGMEVELDEDVQFFISDGLYEDDSNKNLEFDVVESFNSVADIDELLHSEIELVKSDYHICNKCNE